MPYTTENGFVPNTFDEQITLYYTEWSQKFNTEVSFSQFEGSKEYSIFYSNAQVDINAQAIFANAYFKALDYIRDANHRIELKGINREKLIKSIEDLGYLASLKPTIIAEAGKSFICIDYNEIAEDKPLIAKTISENIAAGIITVNGASGEIVESHTISNGQSFDYGWVEPTEVDVEWKIQYRVDRNSREPVDTAEAIQQRFYENYDKIYRLGNDIKPEQYYSTISDAPWASEIIISYDLGTGFVTAVLETDYDSRYLRNLELTNIEELP